MSDCLIFEKGDFWGFLKYFLQHYLIYHPSVFTVSEDDGIEPWAVFSKDHRKVSHLLLFNEQFYSNKLLSKRCCLINDVIALAFICN
jgi:hypothetical protein